MKCPSCKNNRNILSCTINKNGQHHSFDDKPAVEYSDGYKFWYLNEKLHREDGPAVEYSDGYKKWYLNGKLHREDGPAIEYSDGYKKWYLNGKIAIKYPKGLSVGKCIEIDKSIIILKNINENIWLGLCGDEKVYIGSF